MRETTMEERLGKLKERNLEGEIRERGAQ